MSSPEAKSQSFVTPTKKVQLKAQVHAIGASSHSFSYGNTIICAFCGAAHTNFSCETFSNRSPIERRQDVLRLKLCLNCLGHHMVKECKSTRTCRICGRKHNTLLHDTASSEPGSAASVHLARPLQQRRIVLLATAQVIVRSPSGLQLPRIRASVRICGIGATESTTARYQVNLVVQSRLFPEAQYSLSAVVLPKLTGRVPPQLIKPVEQIQIDPAHLADPQYFREAKIGLILGADVYGSLLRQGLYRAPGSQVVAQDTTLGWVITGSVSVPEPSAATASVFHCSVQDDPVSELRCFWELEEVSSPEQSLSPEDALCEKHFSETYSRDSEGRFVVRLPRRPNVPLVGDNNRFACDRSLRALERWLDRDHVLKEKYDRFLHQYEELGHMSVVSPQVSSMSQVLRTRLMSPPEEPTRSSSVIRPSGGKDPPWLLMREDCWPTRVPKPPSSPGEEAPRKLHTYVAQADEGPWDLITRYSSLSKLLRVTALCIRFYRRCRSDDASDISRVDELRDAKLRLIRYEQSRYYSEELSAIARRVPLPRHSSLLPLHPLVSPDGTIRVGGRLENSCVPVNFLKYSYSNNNS
jgi:hypothetical protein